MIEGHPVLLPKLTLTFNYVLILEWLSTQDRRTGEELHQFLQGLPISTCLVRCDKVDDIRAALKRAVANVGTRGIPVIHIESHGSNPFQGRDVREAEFGLDAAPGLPWIELGDWLAPLNEASGFRLLVIGATCWGFAAIAAMKVHEHVAPFASAVGLSTGVDEGSLHDAMKELYRVMVRGEGLRDAMQAAERELRSPTEKLRGTSAPILALRILRGVYDEVRTPEQRTERANEILRKVQEAGFPVREGAEQELPDFLHDRGEARIKEAWDAWFPPSAQKAEPAYRLDWDWIRRTNL
ncbi:MAG: hypothetical protein WBR15_07210 [Gammaproteobacteria bacterium]